METVTEHISSRHHEDNCLGNDVLVSLKEKDQVHVPQRSLEIHLFGLSFSSTSSALFAQVDKFSELIPHLLIFGQNRSLSVVDYVILIAIVHYY